MLVIYQESLKYKYAHCLHTVHSPPTQNAHIPVNIHLHTFETWYLILTKSNTGFPSSQFNGHAPITLHFTYGHSTY